MGGKILGIHEANHFIALDLYALVVEKDNGRWSKDPEALQEFLVLFVVGGDICLQQHAVRQYVVDDLLGEG